MANNNRGRVPEAERCLGTSRQSKERCKRRRSPGSEFCIFHGGRTLVARRWRRRGVKRAFAPAPGFLISCVLQVKQVRARQDSNLRPAD